MQEFRWEIWSGKRNTLHKIEMDVSERPIEVFQRISQMLEGSENALKMRVMDPNTGREVDTKWKFSYRLRGEGHALKEDATFEAQGVTKGALLVLRPVEIRANTIYIDGAEGLGLDELSSAKSKAPLIFLLSFILIVGGALGYYFLYKIPHERAIAPHELKIQTLPEKSQITLVLDVSAIKNYKKKFKIGGKFLQRGGTTSLVTRYSVKIPKKSKVIYVSIANKGYISWKRGIPLKKWEEKGSSQYLDLKQLLSKGYFPKKLKKEPPKPKFKVVPTATPKAFSVKYPRRWRGARVGIDPMLGGKNTGFIGEHQQPTSKLNLVLASLIKTHLRKQRRRRFRVYLSRSKAKNLPLRTRLRKIRRARFFIQLNMASGLSEFAKNNQTIKKKGSSVIVNNGVAGFQIFWSSKNRRAKRSKKLALCLGKAMNQAGFKPRPPRKGEQVTDAALGVRPVSKPSPILDGRKPAIRLVAGYLSHQKEEAILINPENLKIIAQAVESAIICYKSR